MNTTHYRRRPGFSLIELLIVLAIIGVVVALTAGAAMRLLGSSQTGATRTTLSRLEDRLQSQMTVRMDRAREAVIPDPVKQLSTPGFKADNLNRGNYNHDLAKVINTKLRLKAEFPQTFDEAVTPGPGYVLPVPAYVKFLAQRNIASSASIKAKDRKYESAICLYMALKFGPEAASDADAGSGGAVIEFPLTVTVGGKDVEVTAPGYADSWGEPLLFCRWPLGTAPGSAVQGTSNVFPGGAASGFDDPADPKNILQTAFNNKADFATNLATFQALLHPVYPRKGGATSYPRLAPVIMSSGGDRQMGITDTKYLGTWDGTANDNIITERFR